jgi:hypothetical protein
MQAGLVRGRLAWRDIFTARRVRLRVFVAAASRCGLAMCLQCAYAQTARLGAGP